jgi:A/G-specific adenine glycosylase
MTVKRESGNNHNLSVSEEFQKMVATDGLSPRAFSRFREIILAFYKKHGREMPWRNTTNPYHIYVSEIMLQQTQVERVNKKYPGFIATFPSFADLADAPLHKILAVWQGMGYNRRAIALQACAGMVIKEHNGFLPSDVAVLETLPGIGHATACSIAAFAFNTPVVFIETNIRRVFIHFFFEGLENISDEEILPIVSRALYAKDPRTWYSALMDYGTMLKSAGLDPNRRSAHHTKQPKFDGSDREIRGIVVKTLVQDSELDEKSLVRKINRDPGRVLRIIGILEKEGFLVRDKNRITLSGRGTHK